MKVIAQRGPNEFAVAMDDPEPGTDFDVVLYNDDTGDFSRPFRWQSLLARGYWDEPDPGRASMVLAHLRTEGLA